MDQCTVEFEVYCDCVSVREDHEMGFTYNLMALELTQFASSLSTSLAIGIIVLAYTSAIELPIMIIFA